MEYPSVFDRVQVSGRSGQFVIVRVDHFASLVDICPQLGNAALERDIPFDLLSKSADPKPDYSDSPSAGALISGREVLYSSSVQLASSRRAVIELRNLVQATRDSIGITQEQIVKSDRLIARSPFARAEPRQDPD